MEEQEVTALIAIDLSAAFDTVDHDILLNVLQKQYGACGTALNWIDSRNWIIFVQEAVV